MPAAVSRFQHGVMHMMILLIPSACTELQPGRLGLRLSVALCGPHVILACSSDQQVRYHSGLRMQIAVVARSSSEKIGRDNVCNCRVATQRI